MADGRRGGLFALVNVDVGGSCSRATTYVCMAGKSLGSECGRPMSEQVFGPQENNERPAVGRFAVRPT